MNAHTTTNSTSRGETLRDLFTPWSAPSLRKWKLSLVILGMSLAFGDQVKAQTLLYFQGFNTSAPANEWTYTPSGIAASATAGSGDTPANQRILEGNQSLQLSGGSPASVTFGSVDVSLYDQVYITLRLTGTSSTSGNGLDSTDYVRAFAALNGAAFAANSATAADISLSGGTSTTTNSRWGYDATLVATTTVGTNLQVVAPQGGTSTNNYSTFRINIGDAATAVALRLNLDNDSNEVWNIDSVSIFGTLTVVPPSSTTYYWLGNPDTTLGGSGTWDTGTTASWSASTSSIAPVTWESSKTANFGGATAGTVTVTAEGVAANNGMQFETGGYLVNGGAVTLGGADAATNSITTTAGTTTFNASLAGTHGMTKVGVAKLVLAGDDTGLSGGIVLTSGTLAVGHANALGANAVALNGGTFTSSDATAYTISNAITFGGDTALGEVSTGNLKFNNTIGFAGSTRLLTVASGVTVELAGTTANGGINKGGLGGLAFSASNSLTTLGISAGTAIIDAGKTLTLTAAPLTSSGGAITINGTLLSTATTQWTAPAGTVQVASTGTVIQQGNGSPTNFLFNANTTFAPGSTFIFRDYTSPPSVSGRTYASNLTFDSSGGAVAVGALAGSGAWTVNGNLTIGANVNFDYGTHSGGTIFNGNVTVNGTLGATNAAESFTIAGGKALSVNAGGILNIASARTVTVSSGATAQIAGTLGGAGGLTTAGTTTITGTGSFTGATLVSGGTLEAGGVDALSGTSGIKVNTGGTLLLSGSGNLNRIRNGAGIELAGGTLAIPTVGGASEGVGATSNAGASVVGLGTLTLSVNSTLDFGSGGVGTLVFAGYSPGNFTLNVIGYTSAASGYNLSQSGVDGIDDRLIFSGTQLGNLGKISFGGIGATQIQLNDGSFEIVPVPEPATILGALGVLGMVAWRERRCFSPWR